MFLFFYFTEMGSIQEQTWEVDGFVFSYISAEKHKEW